MIGSTVTVGGMYHQGGMITDVQWPMPFTWKGSS